VNTTPATPQPAQPAEPSLADALRASLAVFRGREHEPTRRCWCTGEFHNGQPPDPSIPASRRAGAADGGSLTTDMQAVLDHAATTGTPAAQMLTGWTCTRCRLLPAAEHGCDDKACVCCFGESGAADGGDHA
jgi:dienelactone hydrolase